MADVQGLDDSPLPPDQKPSEFAGFFDRMVEGQAFGWALDLSAPHEPVWLEVIIDQKPVGRILCDQPRPDVQNIYKAPSARPGFSYDVPADFLDGQPHTLTFRLPDGSILRYIHPQDHNIFLREATFTEWQKRRYQAHIDGFKNGALRGWVHLLSPGGQRLGNCEVFIMADDRPLAQVRANHYRADVVAALGTGDPNCGFEVVLPPLSRPTGPVRFRFFTIPDYQELDGSPLTASLFDNQTEEQILFLAASIDQLHRQLSQLRLRVAELIPRAGYHLDDYHRWAQVYYQGLKRRVAALRRTSPLKQTPLVSIICPVYKPRMEDFTAAVHSVLEQSYPHWELILVDDGMPCPEISARIEAFCAQEPRIRAVSLKRNRGIAEATNAGIKEAKGEWIAFFDHDDLLVPEALEVMIRSAHTHKARLVYSDEDKIDQAGYFLEPNLKPDFNHRYLLGCNYICHLLLVQAGLVRKAGKLLSRYNGAQDHDFILRLTELVPPGQIHHTAEILYHWRKTPNSTAVSIGNKDYAVKAGLAAVADHLARLGKKAQVRSINHLTLYNVRWAPPEQEPPVSIIIPFKDQAETTRTCLEQILGLTRYDNYRITLVNNWSMTQEARQLCQEMKNNPRIRLLTVEEPFNYARLNNLAADQHEGFYFFMNNDVFIEDAHWLSLVVAEACSFDDIGVVGGKYLYPNRMIQHAGVVVGPEGVAAHVHKGLAHDDYGFVGRAVLSHELSAVTGAAMLVRADIFHQVGGFDEEHLAVAYNDIDLCLKIRRAGYRVIANMDFVACHHESLSRGEDMNPWHESRFFREMQTMQKRWGRVKSYQRDPFYSPHLTVNQRTFHNLQDPEGYSGIL